MTVTDLRNRRAETEQALTGLAERIELAVENSIATIALETARAMANEAGLHRFQDELLDCEDQLRQAIDRRRVAAKEKKEAERAHLAAQREARYLLDGHFVSRSNKQWLAKTVDGRPIAEDDQRSFDAPGRKDWVRDHADLLPAVQAAQHVLDDADDALLEAEIDVDLITRATRHRTHLIDAACVELSTLALAIQHHKNGASK